MWAQRAKADIAMSANTNDRAASVTKPPSPILPRSMRSCPDGPVQNQHSVIVLRATMRRRAGYGSAARYQRSPAVNAQIFIRPRPVCVTRPTKDTLKEHRSPLWTSRACPKLRFPGLDVWWTYASVGSYFAAVQ